LHVSHDPKRRRNRLAFSVEDVERVLCPKRESERIEVNCATHLRMHTAEVEDKLTVDEDPHVVIALEAEYPAAVDVAEDGVVLRGEQVVVRRLESRVNDLVEAAAVHREVALRVKDGHAGR